MLPTKFASPLAQARNGIALNAARATRLPQLALLALAASQAGCASLPDPAPREPQAVQIDTIDRAIDCGTTGLSAKLTFFADGAAFNAWQQTQGTALRADADLAAGQALILVEMGQRRTGGYFLTVDDAAVYDVDDVLRMSGVWTEPGQDRIVTQILTSPCVLAKLPALDYAGFRIVDQSGELRASLTPD